MSRRLSRCFSKLRGTLTATLACSLLVRESTVDASLQGFVAVQYSTRSMPLKDVKESIVRRRRMELAEELVDPLLDNGDFVGENPVKYSFSSKETASLVRPSSVELPIT